MKTRNLLIIFVVILSLILTSSTLAKESPQVEAVIAGGQLYDSWFKVNDVDPPDGNMPIWDRQESNTRTGADTWRCVECHGWDYKGVDGAYGAGSHYTGFPNLIKAVDELDKSDIIEHLSGDVDSAHNFSQYLNPQNLDQLSEFLKSGLIDDSIYIDSVSLGVIGGDIEEGRTLYHQECSECHGDSGQEIVFRTEGVNEYLGSVAVRDPWRFLHRTRFGVAGTDMPIGLELGWTPSDGRDVLYYAQSMPTGFDVDQGDPGSEISETSPKVGGPGSTLWEGILTGTGMFFGMFGSSLILISSLLFFVGIIVWVLRKRSG